MKAAVRSTTFPAFYRLFQVSTFHKHILCLLHVCLSYSLITFRYVVASIFCVLEGEIQINNMKGHTFETFVLDLRGYYFYAYTTFLG